MIIVPRSNFDNLLWSCVTIFQILLQYKWYLIMYDSIRAIGFSSIIYYLFLILIGSIILLNLFLAIILGNFERARNFNIKKKVFNEFNRQIKRGKSLESSIDHILGDLAVYVKSKILKKKERIEIK